MWGLTASLCSAATSSGKDEVVLQYARWGWSKFLGNQWLYFPGSKTSKSLEGYNSGLNTDPASCRKKSNIAVYQLACVQAGSMLMMRAKKELLTLGNRYFSFGLKMSFLWELDLQVNSVSLQEVSEKGRKIWTVTLEQGAGLGLADVCHCTDVRD